MYLFHIRLTITERPHDITHPVQPQVVHPPGTLNHYRRYPKSVHLSVVYKIRTRFTICYRRNKPGPEIDVGVGVDFHPDGVSCSGPLW